MIIISVLDEDGPTILDGFSFKVEPQDIENALYHAKELKARGIDATIEFNVDLQFSEFDENDFQPGHIYRMVDDMEFDPELTYLGKLQVQCLGEWYFCIVWEDEENYIEHSSRLIPVEMFLKKVSK